MEPLVTLLVGHRGTGKTSFLDRICSYAHERGLEWSCLDLDEEIARHEGCSASEVFARGEELFRQREKDLLYSLIRSAKQRTFISVGAGFEGPPPAGAHILWLRRSTDGDGRAFMNRPRLDPDISPFEEYRTRFEQRDKRYAAWADEQLYLPEGDGSELTEFIDDKCNLHLPYALTILPENMRSWKTFWQKRHRWGLRHVELRDDLLSAADLERLQEEIPRDQILMARRRVESPMPPADIRVDWALELGPPPRNGSFIVSLHQRDSRLNDCFARLSAFPSEIEKLAVEIHSFSELREGHEWWLKSPTRRAFLPMSIDGRWRWYRSLFGPRMPIHFFREGKGSALDQPMLWQMLLQAAFNGNFAAVLGSPVEHSRTPMEHRLFFKFPVVSIDVKKDEFDVAIPILRQLGLKAAAVTSPLKQKAKEIATVLTAEVRTAGSANTLWFSEADVYAHNTDVLALRRLRGEIPAHSVWLWGGGGVKGAVKSVWPAAREISARAGTVEEGQPDLLIWAVGRSREFSWPSERILPKQILDLNYGEDSPGLEWAVQRSISYQSGLRMFRLQAEYQRQFWRERGAL